MQNQVPDKFDYETSRASFNADAEPDEFFHELYWIARHWHMSGSLAFCRGKHYDEPMRTATMQCAEVSMRTALDIADFVERSTAA